MQFITGGMHHTPSTSMVFQTDDYKSFNLVKGNRTLDMNKIKKILADIERGTNLLKYCPILVVERNKKLEIIDGQHRFMVAKKIKHAVHYIMAEEMSLYDIARMNSNTEKWKSKDFINCYCELGNQNYLRLDEFLKTYNGLPVTTAVTLLSSGKVAIGGNGMEQFQRGLFEIKEFDRATLIMNEVNAFDHSAKYSRPFIQAIVKVIDAGIYPASDLAAKVNADPSQLQQQANYKKYLINLEEIAGKGKHKKVNIY